MSSGNKTELVTMAGYFYSSNPVYLVKDLKISNYWKEIPREKSFLSFM